MPGARTWDLPIAVLLAGLLLSLGGWELAQRYVEAEAARGLASDAARLEAELAGRMEAYTLALRGGAGLFEASTEVTREDWATYHRALALDAQLPGMLGFGFALRIPASQLDEHVAAVRAEGFPEYDVHPREPARDEYTSIVYLEPFSERNQRAFGFDMFSEPVRRDAMARARDTGEAALSATVTLLQENGTDVQPGFLLYLPIYAKDAPTATVEERRAALLGYVYGPFRAHDFVEGIEASHADVHVELYDGQGPALGSLLYRSEGPPAGEGTTSTLLLAGHPWTVIARPSASSLSPGLPLLPIAVLVGALVASGLLFGIVLAMSTRRARAIEMAESMTKELRLRTRELEATNQALRQFSYVVSHDLKEPVRGIDVYLRVLEEDHGERLDAEARSFLASARAANARLSGLLSALLELSRADNERLRLSAVDVEALARSEPVRAVYETLERERSAQLEVAPCPPVLAAPGVLGQALANLIANGMRHNPAPKPHVRVRGDRRGDAVAIVVEDNGAGFPPALIAAFASGRLETTGFGLLLARQATERLLGRMELGRSEALGGAKVTLTLPAAAAPEAAPRRDDPEGPRTRDSSSASP